MIIVLEMTNIRIIEGMFVCASKIVNFRKVTSKCSRKSYICRIDTPCRVIFIFWKEQKSIYSFMQHQNSAVSFQTLTHVIQCALFLVFQIMNKARIFRLISSAYQTDTCSHNGGIRRKYSHRAQINVAFATNWLVVAPPDFDVSTVNSFAFFCCIRTCFVHILPAACAHLQCTSWCTFIWLLWNVVKSKHVDNISPRTNKLQREPTARKKTETSQKLARKLEEKINSYIVPESW